MKDDLKKKYYDFEILRDKFKDPKYFSLNKIYNQSSLLFKDEKMIKLFIKVLFLMILL